MGGSRGRLVSEQDRDTAIELIKEACAQGARRHKACEILDISIRTLERWEKDRERDKRKGAKRTVANKLTEEEKAMILEIVNSPDYRDLSPCQIVPRLADKGIYIASESSFYRILRDVKQLEHRQRSKPPTHKKPAPCIATGSNQVWSWDITYLPTQVFGIYIYLYMIIDIYSRKIVGWSVHEEQCSEHAANLIRQACIDENVERDQLTLHSDNGKPMKGATMLAMLEKLGVAPSFSRPSVSDDNPFSEALFKTVKYHPTFPITTKFQNITDARRWVVAFTDWYNNEHRHSALKFVTPNQRHQGDDKEILENRHKVYLQAKEKRPERWSRDIRDWQPSAVVTLNPNKKAQHKNVEELGEYKLAA